MAREKVFASPEATIAIGRQRGEGYYNRRTTNLLPLLMTSFTPTLSGAMSNLGIEVGGGSITEQRGQKESFSPTCTLSGHVRVGALMNLLTAIGYTPITKGESLGSPVTTDTDGPHYRGARRLSVTASTGISVGDYVMVGAVSGTPAVTDTCEVHRVAAVASALVHEVQTITLYGSPTGGTFRLRVGPANVAANFTTPLAYNAANSVVQAALVALPLIGAGGVTVTGSGPWVVTYTSVTGGGEIKIAGDGDELTGGTGYGANAGLIGQNDSYVDVQVTTPGARVVSLLLDTGLLYDYNDGAAVEKVDANKPYTTYFFHIQPSNPLDNDGFTLYVKFSNGTNTFSLMYFDGKATSFNMSYQTGQIGTFQTDLKFQDVVVVTDPTTVTFGVDTSSVTMNNTRGAFRFLGNHVDAPRGINLTLASEVPDDFTIFRYKPQSIVHTGHTINMTTEGKFVKDLSDKINFNGSDATVSDIIPEYPLQFDFLSQKLIGSTTTPYGFSIVATDVQYGEYNPQLSTNQFVTANMGMMKIVPDSTGERWYMKTTSKSSSDIFGPL